MDTTFRVAQPRDLDDILAFGYAVVPQYFAPLLGPDVARSRLAEWTEHHMRSAVASSDVHVAEVNGAVVGVSETGRLVDDHVLWKLYIAPDFRGRGLGSQLLRHAIASLPAEANHILVGHFAGNARGENFFERAGFRVVGREPPMFGAADSAMVWRRWDFFRDRRAESGSSGDGPLDDSS